MDILVIIKLYGLRMSNYYSLTKALLIEKGLEFEEVKAPPSQKEDYLGFCRKTGTADFLSYTLMLGISIFG
jgi:hypothetical protein